MSLLSCINKIDNPIRQDVRTVYTKCLLHILEEHTSSINSVTDLLFSKVASNLGVFFDKKSFFRYLKKENNWVHGFLYILAYDAVSEELSLSHKELFDILSLKALNPDLNSSINGVMRTLPLKTIYSSISDGNAGFNKIVHMNITKKSSRFSEIERFTYDFYKKELFNTFSPDQVKTILNNDSYLTQKMLLDIGNIVYVGDSTRSQKPPFLKQLKSEVEDGIDTFRIYYNDLTFLDVFKRFFTLSRENLKLSIQVYNGLSSDLANRLRTEYEEQINALNAMNIKLQEKNAEIELAKKESDRKSDIFKIYLTPSLIERVNKGENPSFDNFRTEKMAVLFSDIREFTKLSEIMSTTDVAKFLNAYFDRMSNIIKNTGDVDKLIGDCIMAHFTSAQQAVDVGINMRLRLQEYNLERYNDSSREVIHLKTGIGIHYGEVMLGNIGSPKMRFDYTVTGDNVNISSRLEELTKQYMVDFLISESTYNEIENKSKHNIRKLGNVQVKGRNEPIKIFEIYDHEPDYVKKVKKEISSFFETAQELYINGDVEGAHKIYTQLLHEVPRHSQNELLPIDPVILFFKEYTESIIKSGIHKEKDWYSVYKFRD